MKAKRPLFIGTGIVVALSCGLAPLPAFAASPASYVPASLDAGTQFEDQIVGQFRFVQGITPTLGSANEAIAAIRIHNDGPTTAKGNSMTFRAPSGTTFASNVVKHDWAGGTSNRTGQLSADKKTLNVTVDGMYIAGGAWNTFNARLKADTNLTTFGMINDGSLTFTSGGIPAGTSGQFGYVAAKRALTVSQSSIPKLAPGASATTTIRVTNPLSADSLKGGTFTVASPTGTTFTSNKVTLKYSGGQSALTATLSSDRTLLTLPVSNFWLGANGGWNEILVQLTANRDLTALGLVTDGEVAFQGTAFPEGGRGSLSYEAIDPVTVTQSGVPTIAPSEVASSVITVTNLTDKQTATGTTFVATAPEGTTFASTNAPIIMTDGYATTWIGNLSADKRTLTFVRSGFSLPARAAVDIRMELRSDADNTRIGTIDDGSFRVTAGSALPIGETGTLSYTSAYEAPVIERVVLSAPTVGGVVTDTKRPVFSGTANPGATVTVTGSSGRVVATTTAKADGTWSVPASFDLGNGSYFGTVSQSADGSTARYEFSVNIAADPEAIVTPVTLTGPALDASLAAGKPVFTGKGHPGATVVVKGAFGTPLGSTTVDPQGNWSVESTVSLGAASYSGTAVQTVNDKTSSAGFRFVIQKAEAAITPVTLTSPAIGSEVDPGKPVFTGKGHPGATVTLQGTFGTPLGSGVVKADGTWSIPSTVSLVVGSYSGTAKQNVDGKVTTAPFTFTIK